MLEQEPCEDAISREALLKKCIYAPIAPMTIGDEVHYKDVVFAKDIVNAEPVYPKPNTGHWEISRYRSVDQTGEIYDDGESLVCSECRCAFKRKLLWRRNFCPSCGIKMEVSG